MTRDKITPIVGSVGLFLFFIQHVLFVGLVLVQIFHASSYKTASYGTFTVAEAAYVNSLWTQVVVSVGAWIAWTAFCGTFIVANRITRLHEAYISGFPASPTQAEDPAGPRIGNHSLAGVTRQETYGDRRYAVHGDGMVVGRAGTDIATWRNEAEFKAWADRQALQ